MFWLNPFWFFPIPFVPVEKSTSTPPPHAKNVIQLIKNEPCVDSSTIEFCRSILSEAEAGEVIAVAMLGIRRDGTTATVYDGTRASLYWNLEYLKCRVYDDAFE